MNLDRVRLCVSAANLMPLHSACRRTRKVATRMCSSADGVLGCYADKVKADYRKALRMLSKVCWHITHISARRYECELRVLRGPRAQHS